MSPAGPLPRLGRPRGRRPRGLEPRVIRRGRLKPLDPAELTTPPTLLLARAAAEREQPWLFVQRGLDWRWRSYGAVAARVELLRAAVAEVLAGLERPRAGETDAVPRVGFEDSGRPSALALDLAIQAAGGCSAPLPAGLDPRDLDVALEARGCSLLARFEPRSGEDAPPAAAVPAVSLPRHRPSERAAPSPAAGWAGGPVLVASTVEAAAFDELSPAALRAAADRFAARLAEARAAAAAASGRRARRRAGREILVLPRPLHHPAGRLLATWALAAGAALALEPDPGHRIAAAQWVRPTVFAGDPGEVVALRAALGERRRRGLPLRRLAAVAVLGGAGEEAALAESERRFWSDRGTAVTVV